MTDQEDWYGPHNSTFGDRISGARAQAGLSQSELAKRLGIRLSTLRSWENDQSEPRANRLSVIAGLLNVPLVWLITGEGEGIKTTNPQTSQDRSIRDLMLEIRMIRTNLIEQSEALKRLEKRVTSTLRDTNEN